MFVFAAFVLAAVGSGAVPRGARAAGDDAREPPGGAGRAGAAQPPPLRRLPRTRRGGRAVRRRGGVVGPFQHARDFRLSPGQTAKIGGYSLTYVRPTAKLASEKVSFGAVLRVRRGGKDLGTLRPTRGYYPTLEPDKGPVAGDLRRPGHERGRPARRAAARPLDRGRTRHRPAAALHLRGRPPVRQGRARRAGRGRRGARSALRAAPAAGDVPHHRLAAVAWIWIGSFIAVAGGLISRGRRPRWRAAAPRPPPAPAPRANPCARSVRGPWTS